MNKHLLRIMTIIVILALSFNMVITANASETPTKEVLVPLRFICEAQGGTVTWDNATKTAQVISGGNSLKVTPGSEEATINGISIVLDNKVQIIEGRVKVPLSLINRAFMTNLTMEDSIKLLAVKYIALLQQGDISDCIMLFSDYMKKDVPPAIVKQLAMNFKMFGELKQDSMVISKNSIHQNVTISYTSPVLGPFAYTVRFNAQGLIDDGALTQAVSNVQFKTPDYDNPSQYTEKEVVIGEGEWQLPGTLTLPKGEGPFPVVVLVHGSGPNDQDETIMGNRPFRDLAVGLASKNIAVLRYNKRTFEHGLKIVSIEKFTVKEETIDDAISAIGYLSKLQEIDASKIFVLGHSQGALLVPKIIQADKDGKIKGAVIMSGNTRPLQNLMLEQYEYLLGLNMATKEQYEAIKAQIAFINDPSFSGDNPPTGYQMGNAYWWADLKKYDPLLLAKDETSPMLILQGERDYQVRATTDFKGWKDALSDKANVSFKLYPKLNHLYMEGEGALSTPLEYNNPANIPVYVIDDISAWILLNAK